MKTDLPLAPARVSRPVALAGVLAASAGFGIVPYFARGLTEAGMAPHAIAFARYVAAAAVFSPVLFGLSRHDRPAVLWGMGAGAGMGLGWIGYVTALDSLPVATVGVLYMTYPVFTLLIGLAMFGDRPTRRGLIAVGMILAAAVLATGPLALPPGAWPAVLLALAAPTGFGLGINVLVHRLSALPALARIASVATGSIAGLLPLVLATPVAALVPSSPAGWWLVLGIALGSALVPQLLYTVCAPVLGAARSAVAGSIELPTMLAIGWLAMGEPLGPAQVLACALVIAAIAVTPDRRPRSIATPLGPADGT